MKGAVINMEHC